MNGGKYPQQDLRYHTVYLIRDSRKCKLEKISYLDECIEIMAGIHNSETVMLCIITAVIFLFIKEINKKEKA